MKKRMLALLLAVVMVMTMLPVTALAASGPCDGTNCEHAAAIGDTHYDTLSEAVAAAENNSVIRLLRNLDLSESGLAIPEGKTLTLDLNGKELKVNNTAAGRISVYGSLTIQDSTDTAKDGSGTGKIYTETDYSSVASACLIAAIGENALVTLESGYIYAVRPEDTANKGQFGLGVIEGGDITVTGGKVEAGWYAISGNGTDATQNAVITITGGTLISTADYAVYLPHSGTTEITGGTIYGAAGGVSIQRGTLNIGGSALITSKGTGDTGDWGDGTGGQDCAALNVNAGYGDCTVSIIGGKLIAEEQALVIVGDTHDTNIAITGGEFSSDVSAYIGDDYVCSQNSDGTYTVAPLGAQNAVASIETAEGTTYYKTLTDAFAAAVDGQTIKLLKNTTTAEKIQITDAGAITLDLNDKIITSTAAKQFISLNNADAKLTITDNGTGEGTIVSSTGDYIFCIFGGELNIQKGTVQANGYWVYSGDKYGNTIVWLKGATDPDAENYSKFVLGSDAKLICAEQTASGDPIGDGYAVMIDYNGTAAYGTVVDLWGETEHAGLYVQGMITETSGNVPAWTLHQGAYIDGGIYAAGYAKWNIDGATVIGNTGMEIRAGELSVADGSVITGTGTPTEVKPNGNGSTTSGAGLAVAQHTTKLPITVTINGGTISGFTGVYESNPQNNSAADIEKVNIKINGGHFAAINGGTNAVSSEDEVLTVHGGYFTSDPSAYLAADKVVLTSDQDGYAFMVGNQVIAEAEPAAGDPVVDDSKLPASMTEEDKEAVVAAASTVSDSGELAAAANSILSEVTEDQAKAAEQAYENSELPDGTITVYAQTYLDITPTAYDVKGILTLEIKPMYRVVATTEDNPADIIVKGEETSGESPNAVVLAGSEKELTSVKTMTISIDLPVGFPTDNLFIEHTKNGAFVAYHKVTVDSNNVLTFVNDKGFSTFTVKVDDRTATVNFGCDIGTKVLTPADVGTVLPTAAAPAGQVFGGWIFDGIDGTFTTLTNDLLTALDGQTDPITATAYFYTPSSATTYSVSVSSAANGKVTTSTTRASKGSTVTITVKPDEGYALDQLTVTDANGNAVSVTKVSDTKYTFKMPAAKVTVKATFEKAELVSSLPFTDVDVDDWFYEAVEYVYDNGMMNGVSDTKFAPDAQLTRGMIVTILWRLENEPQVNYLMTFGDVAADQWYTEAVRWAAAEGIVTGYDADTFGPNNSITREQLAAILYRYAEYKDYDVSVGEDTNILSYTDFSQIHEYAIPAFQWACGSGVINGVTDSTLVPGGTATRAQVATMLMRFCETVAK